MAGGSWPLLGVFFVVLTIMARECLGTQGPDQQAGSPKAFPTYSYAFVAKPLSSRSLDPCLRPPHQLPAVLPLVLPIAGAHAEALLQPVSFSNDLFGQAEGSAGEQRRAGQLRDIRVCAGQHKFKLPGERVRERQHRHLAASYPLLS